MTRATVIDWRSLIQPCTEIVRPHAKPFAQMTTADLRHDSEYRRKLYALVSPFIPRATIAAYARADEEMSQAGLGFEEEHEYQPAELEAFDAIKHEIADRAYHAPAEDVADVVARLLFVAGVEDDDAFPDAWVKRGDLLRTAVADLRRFGAIPPIPE
jgi:hypothetical protein